jgi:two-component system, LytTR family, response regulator
MTLRTLVIDDEELPRQAVRELVNGHPALSLVGEASDGREALDEILDHRPDLVFLDIQMPELDGFQVVAALDDDVLPAIVFVTAYDAFAIKAFEVNAIDYLMKPVTPERFAAAVARVESRVGQAQAGRASIRGMLNDVPARAPATRFVARRGQKHYFVRVADVDWIEADGNYLRLVTADTSHLIRETMKSVEARLDPSQFLRVHRSAIVAIDRIKSIETREHGDYVITMANGAKLETSRGYGDRVRALLR